MRLLLRIGLLAVKQLVRHRARSLLTIAGVSTGMFLFSTLE